MSDVEWAVIGGILLVLMLIIMMLMQAVSNLRFDLDMLKKNIEHDKVMQFRKHMKKFEDYWKD